MAEPGLIQIQQQETKAPLIPHGRVEGRRTPSVWSITTDLTKGSGRAKIGDKSEFDVAHAESPVFGTENLRRTAKRDMNNQLVQSLVYKDPFANVYKKYVPQTFFFPNPE